MDTSYIAETRELPPSVAVLVVDTKGFSAHDDRQQQRLAELIPVTLEQAAHRCGLAELWDGRRFPDSTGDGYFIGFDPALLPRVVDDYLDALQAELRDQAPPLRALGITFRMRLSLVVGPLDELPEGQEHLDAPAGKTMIDAHRLVDALPTRAMLGASDPEVTFLAAVLSERVVEDVVRCGRTRRVRESQLVASEIVLEEKDFRTTAYIRVPTPSGSLLATGVLGGLAAGEAEPAEADRESEPAPDQTAGDTGQPGPSARIGRVGGRVGVAGASASSGGVIAGGDVDQSSRTSVGGSQYTAGRNISVGAAENGAAENGADDE